MCIRDSHSGDDLNGKKYIFATIQTLSREDNLKAFSKDFFDYILIDEVHKAGADSYKKVMGHFTPVSYTHLDVYKRQPITSLSYESPT